MKKTKFIITSGSTFVPWDDVRGITNHSKGTTGAKIAEYFAKNFLVNYEESSIKFITQKGCKTPFEKHHLIDVKTVIDYLSNLGQESYVEYAKEFNKDIEEYRENSQALKKIDIHLVNDFYEYLDECLNQDVDENTVFISCAAVSDYGPKRVDGKIASSQNAFNLQLEKLPKVIGLVKNKFPKMPIIGFKLLSSKDHNVYDLVEIGYKSLLDGKLAMVVCNLVDEKFKPVTTLIITPEKGIIPVSRENLEKTLLDLIETRLVKSRNGFLKTVIDSEPMYKEETLETMNKSLDVCNRRSLFSASYSKDGEYKNAEFGSIAVRDLNGRCMVTGRGVSKNKLSKENVVMVNAVENGNIVISSFGEKATLNAPTLFKILEERPDINIVIHSHVYLMGATTFAETSPSSIQDFKDIEPFLHYSNVINQKNHGVLILLEKIEDLDSILEMNSIYISHAQDYEVAYRRFNKTSLFDQFKYLTRLLPDIDNLEVLDMACGTGLSTKQLYKHFKNISIADRNEAMLDECFKNLDKEGLKIKNHFPISFSEIDQINKKFDLITIRQAINYMDIDEFRTFVQKSKVVLNKNGTLYFNTFAKLDDGVYKRDNLEITEDGFIETFETNEVVDGKVIHSQLTNHLNKSKLNRIYDINTFVNHDAEKLKDVLREEGFNPHLIMSKNSIIFVSKKTDF